MTRAKGTFVGYCTAEDHCAEVPTPEVCIVVDGKDICLNCLIVAATPYLMFRGDCLDPVLKDDDLMRTMIA